jgi:hypothetical protein
MQETGTTAVAPAQSISDALVLPGRILYALAFASFGVETIVCSRMAAFPLGPGYSAIPIIPWVPAIPVVACLFGALWIACASGTLVARWRRPSALVLGSVLALCTFIIIVPRYAVTLGDMGMRTVVFEPLTLACIAFLLPGTAPLPAWITRTCRYLICLGLIVFGVDHFLGLTFIASLLPDWIPFHAFWVVFFGAALIAGGLSIASGFFASWGAAGTGLIFGIWVISLHLPRVLGLYGIPGAPKSPDEWSSMLIALGLWGGFWALAGNSSPKRRTQGV